MHDLYAHPGEDFFFPAIFSPGNTQSFQVNRRYPWDLRGSVISAPKYSWNVGRARLSPLSPLGSLGTGGTQFFQPPRYPGDWRNSVHSAPHVPWGLAEIRPPCTHGTGGIQSFQPPRHPVDWRHSVFSAPEVRWGLAGLTPAFVKHIELVWDRPSRLVLADCRC